MTLGRKIYYYYRFRKNKSNKRANLERSKSFVRKSKILIE